MNAYELSPDEFSYSHEAEGAVIAAVLNLGPDAYDAAGLTAAMFFQPVHQVLWTEMEKLIVAGRHVDVVELMQAMRGADMDWHYVQELASTYTTLRGARGHARIVRDFAKARALKAAAREVGMIANDESITIEQRVSQSVAQLEAVIEVRADKDAMPVSTFVADFLGRLQDMADGNIQPARPTRVPTLDRLLSGGLRDEQLVIVAARPSVGKSSFAQQLALSAAQDGVPAAFFGMEMTSRELTNRTVANIGRAPLSGIKTGNLSNEEWSRVVEGVEALRDLPLYLYDQPGMTLAEVVSKARKLVRKHGVKLLVVDYLQLMKGSGARVDRRVELEEITRGAKQMAKQLGITVVLLSQLNREVEKRSNPRPVMSDLKECGAIEEDADVILALWTHRKGEEGQADIKGCAVLKNRDGQTGEVALHFEGPFQRWCESTESLSSPSKSAHPSGNRYAGDL